MTKAYDPFNKLSDKIDITAKDLRGSIDKLGSESIKRSDLEHYATKHEVLSTFFKLLATFIGMLGLMCAAYWAITPYIIDSKNSKLENKLDEILTILKPTTDNKIK